MLYCSPFCKIGNLAKYFVLSNKQKYIKLQVVTWKPSGNLSDTISQHFLGGGHQLKNTELIFSSHERYRLTTLATGKDSAQFHIVLRNFDRFGIEC